MQKFYVMVGIPGSGKSYWASRIDGIVHSSDAIRAELLGDAADQSDPGRVFAVLDQRICRDLQAGKDVICDSTNIRHYRRKELLKKVNALHLDLERICVFVDTPLDACRRNNANRDRQVATEVIERMSAKMDTPTLSEGWDKIMRKGE